MLKTCRSAALVALVAAAAPSQAHALCVANSFLFGTVTPLTGSTWVFQYMVQNGCSPGGQQLMTDFFVPYFTDAGITDITVPSPDVTSTTSTITWTATILPDNLFGLPGAGVIDFHVTATPEFDPLPGQPEPGVGYYGASGFSYVANYGAIESQGAIQQIPYAGGTYPGSTLLFVDPPIPDSPMARGALTSTPEPGTMSLAAIGILLTAFGARAHSARRRGV